MRIFGIILHFNDFKKNLIFFYHLLTKNFNRYYNEKKFKNLSKRFKKPVKAFLYTATEGGFFCRFYKKQGLPLFYVALTLAFQKIFKFRAVWRLIGVRRQAYVFRLTFDRRFGCVFK